MQMHLTSNRKIDRESERGAALISVLLISLMILTAGGILILTTGRSSTNTIDATGEMKAYYGAEAGLQAVLNVLRQNVSPSTALSSPPPAPQKINFRIAVEPSTSNAPGDAATAAGTARLSRWLSYSATYTDRVPVNAATYGLFSGSAYSITVVDPDDPTGAARAASATYEPARLLVTSTGYGPGGARKQLQMVMTTITLDYNAKAMMSLIGSNTNNDKMTFDIGNSAAKKYSGQDKQKPSAAPLLSFAVTTTWDKTVAETVISNCNNCKPDTVNSPKIDLITDPNELPEYLRTTDGPTGARAFLNKWRKIAQTVEGTYHPPVTTGYAFSGVAGSNPHDYNFVDGDCDLDGGAGLLIVTGDLIIKGTPSFSGLILVLGKGRVFRSGGGTGTLLGAIAIARFDTTAGATSGFTAPTFDFSGGGGMTMQYDSLAVENAKRIGNKPLGVVEK